MSTDFQPGQHVKVAHDGVVISGPDIDGDYKIQVQHPTLGEDEKHIHGSWLTLEQPKPQPGDVWSIAGGLEVYLSRRRGSDALLMKFTDGGEMTTTEEQFLKSWPTAVRTYTRKV